MVAIVHGSSHFITIGADHVTGGTGATGATGATGPVGYGFTGATGFSGGNISNMYLVSSAGLQSGERDRLHTIFELVDENETRWTSSYTTTTRIRGVTGGAYPLIDGQSVRNSALGGVTFPRGRNSNNEPSSFLLKSIEVAGDALTLVQNEELNTINIHHDPGNFGYLEIVGTDTASVAGELVGLSGSNLAGISGAYYTRSTSSGLPSGANALDIRVKNYKEKLKYLRVAKSNISAPGDDIAYYSGSGFPFYSPPAAAPIDPNIAKTFILDMRQLDGVSGDHGTGFTGELMLHFKDAKFGYTGNGPRGWDATDADGLGKAFTLIVHGATNSGEYSPWMSTPTLDENLIWPLNKPPCWSGGTDIFNFFWLPCTPKDMNGWTRCKDGAAWHGNMVQWHSQGGTGEGTRVESPYCCYGGVDGEWVPSFVDGGDYGDPRGLTFGATGACCVGRGICVHATERSCTGFYNGAGTVCGAGGTGSSCYELGPCCVSQHGGVGINCYDWMSANECVDLNNVLNYHAVFGGTANSCAVMECGGIDKEIGACCDGLGNCEQLSKSECEIQKSFFAGVGTPCLNDDGLEICSGGTGACCTGTGVCINGASGSGCIENSYLYAGNNTFCGDIDCRTTSRHGCVPEVAGLNLKPGDLYAGGMVVGLYHPDGSVCSGSKGFGGSKFTSWQALMSGGTGSTSDSAGSKVGTYQSKYDWHGYGFDSEFGCRDHTDGTDSYYIIVSMDPIGITGDRVLADPNTLGVTNEFYWGNRGSSWGPLYNQIQGTYSDISRDYKYKVFPTSEGYWYNQEIGESSLNMIGPNTYSSCKTSRKYGDGAISKLKTKPIQTAHGMWHRNWGMYNTIRIISADNALYKGYSADDGSYSGYNFGPGLTAGYISSFRATRLYDDDLISVTGVTGSNPSNVSGWYLPSHDEFSFLANNCTRNSNNDFNLNSRLITEGGTPLSGWHWTSTGAYDETKGRTAGIGEGIINPVDATGPLGVTADPGTLAWAIKIDQNGNSNNFLVGKKNRYANTYKVRPIRLVRCDGKSASSTDSNYKLWKLPNVLRDEDIGTNQRY